MFKLSKLSILYAHLKLKILKKKWNFQKNFKVKVEYSIPKSTQHQIREWIGPRFSKFVLSSPILYSLFFVVRNQSFLVRGSLILTFSLRNDLLNCGIDDFIDYFRSTLPNKFVVRNYFHLMNGTLLVTTENDSFTWLILDWCWWKWWKEWWSRKYTKWNPGYFSSSIWKISNK